VAPYYAHADFLSTEYLLSHAVNSLLSLRYQHPQR
jgi:hypothetical protein